MNLNRSHCPKRLVVAGVVLVCGAFSLIAEQQGEKGEVSVSRMLFQPGTVVPPNGSLIVSIPAFKVDELGLPIPPVRLRIAFKDVTGARGKKGQNTLQVTSRIEYRSDDPKVRRDKEEVNLPGLFLLGDDRWKTYKYVFQKMPFQLIRAIDGVFTFRISSSADVPIPVRFAEIEVLTANQAFLNRETERAKLGWRRKFPTDDSSPTLENRETDGAIIAFVREPMRSVYEWSRPSQSEVGRPTRVLAAPGEIEPVSFGLYFGVGASVTVELVGFPAELTERGEWYKEVSDDRVLTQSLATYPTPTFPFSYGRIPDRLEPFNKLTLPAKRSVRLWFKFSVPLEFAGQELQGVVEIRNQGTVVATMDVELSVLPIPLDPSPHMNPVYNDPYSKTYHREQGQVWKFLREVGFDPFFYMDYTRIVVVRDNTGAIVDLDLSHFESLLDEMKAEGFLKNRMIVENSGWLMEREVKQEYFNIYEKLSDPAFREGYGLLVRKIIAACKDRGVAVIFSITDEPWLRIERMMRANRLAVVIRANGGETTTTYDTSADSWLYQQPDGTSIELGLKDLVDHKVWFVYSQGAGFLQGEPGYGYYTTFDSHLRNPIYNRYLHGVLAWRTGADIVSVYALGDISVDPFDDLDGSPDRRWWPDFIFGYPTWKGPFLTALNAEGVKDGIKDARYLATLARLAREFSDNPVAAQADEFLKSITERVDSNYLSSVYGGKWEDFLKGESYRHILEQVSETGDKEDFGVFTAMRSTAVALIKELVAGSELPPGKH